MSSLDFKQVNKDNFKCFQSTDSSVYYGEAEWMDEENKLVYNKDELDEEAQAKLKQVRHGLGVQLYGTTPEGISCKYEGKWDKDKRHGEGASVFPDGGTYQGNWRSDAFDGFGRFEWGNGAGHVYEGNWKDGRMDGGGEFVNGKSQNSLKGIFKNNYFNQDNQHFINPFLNQVEMEEFIKRSQQHSVTAAKEKTAHENRVRLYRIKSS